MFNLFPNRNKERKINDRKENEYEAKNWKNKENNQYVSCYGIGVPSNTTYNAKL